MPAWKHCDDYIKDKTQPKCLRKFLLHRRIPASWQIYRWKDSWGEPQLFATVVFDQLPPDVVKLARQHLECDDSVPFVDVKVNMASRFGDVGITTKLNSANGYQSRMPLAWLTNFRDSA